MKWYFSSHRIDYIVSNFNCQEAFLVYMLQCFFTGLWSADISLILNKKDWKHEKWKIKSKQTFCIRNVVFRQYSWIITIFSKPPEKLSVLWLENVMYYNSIPIRERDAAAFISILIRGRLIRDSIKQCVLETLANTRYFPLKKHCAKYMLGKRERDIITSPTK